MPFRDNNRSAGAAANSQFQVGRNNIDANEVVEQGVMFPWPSDPAASYIYYDCAIGTMLDSGIVVHNRLPQANNTPDTLASINLDDPNLETLVGPGVNIRCNDQYQDIVQRMGHARYWFRIWGQALRIGYQVPIPGIKTIGGVPAIPYDKNPQWAFNRIAPGGNFGGVIMWHAAWSLWYTVAVQPRSNTIPAADPAAHIRGTDTPPAAIQSPFSAADDNSKNSGEPRGFFVGGGGQGQ